MKTQLSLLALIGMICFLSCAKDGFEVTNEYYTDSEYSTLQKHLNLPEQPLEYDLNFPTYYSTSPRTFDNDIATLGRVLFYDKNLSKDRSVSCASCHKQELAFSDDVAFSIGVENRQTDRNSIALGSVFSFQEYYGPGRVPFFWDNRATSVEEQSSQTLANPKEMDMQIEEVTERVKKIDYYKPLFRLAYGLAEITDAEVLNAISVFVNTMGSFDSKFDRALEIHTGSISNIESDFTLFSDLENQGKSLYLTNCASCHNAAFGAPSVIQSNNGLKMNYEDNGVGGITNVSADNAMFKVPTLRNVALTYPYMHDGSLETLEDVLEHYSSGIQNHPNLDPILRDGNSARKFNFTTEDKTALIAFLNTLTDEEYITTEKYSDPFK